MPIVCGIDFSQPAARARRAAAVLAEHMQLPVHLVHAVELTAAEQDDPIPTQRVREAEARLRREVDHLLAMGCKAQIDVQVRVGSPDETLLAYAREQAAQLIVVGALGHRAPGRWQLGSHADRLAQCSHVPVLVVRDPEPFRSWLKDARPLRVMLGADLSHSSDAAMGFIRELRKLGPCDVTAMHLYWPPQQFARLGLGGVRSYLDPDPQVTETIVRELEQRLSSEQETSPRVRTQPHLGRLGDRLAVLAVREQSDLIVVGTHARGAMGRLWEGSVSRDVLHCASSSVLCVPRPAADAPALGPRMQHVLVATDLTSVGNAAVSLACSLLELGGTLHLVHVVPPTAAAHALTATDIFRAGSGSDTEHGAAVEQLRRLIPDHTTAYTTQCHVLESQDPALAICQAAERLDVDAICLATRGRNALMKAMLGSVATAVLSQSKRPVLIAHQPRE